MENETQYEEISELMRSLSNPELAEDASQLVLESFREVCDRDLGKIAKRIGRNHIVAQHLWALGLPQSRSLAIMIDDPKMVTEEQMEDWVKGFDSWGICDACCVLFAKTKKKYAYQKAIQWSRREEEFVKRAGFALMAKLSVHDKEADDEEFVKFFPCIKEQAMDKRHYVKRAVNWALRDIGKRNLNLNSKAIEFAREIQKTNVSPARWIAADAIRELTSEAVQRRLQLRASGGRMDNS